jgi:hypothetical protein
MSYSEYKTVIMPNRPDDGWTGHLRKTGWKYRARGIVVDAPQVEFFIEPNTIFLVMKELPDENYLIRLFGDDQQIECIIDRLNFAMETHPI